MKKLVSSVIQFFAFLLNPFKLPVCRFYPSCSHYANEAMEKHSWFFGLKLIFKRVLRCHPWGGFGYDPVPEKKR